MARIVVQTDDARQTVLDERDIGVQPESEPSAVRLLERIAWAIDDADTRLAAKRRASRRRAVRRGAVRPAASAVRHSFD